MLCWARVTAPQTVQCLPSESPPVVQPAVLPGSAVSVCPLAGIVSVSVVWHLLQVRVFAPAWVQVASRVLLCQA